MNWMHQIKPEWWVIIINVIVILTSGFVATLGYNFIPYKAYVIVAGLAGLCVAWILTKKINKL